jgi:hypothetical protein
MNVVDNRDYQIEDIYELIRGFMTMGELSPKTDVFRDLNIYGDDFYELIKEFAKTFQINMDTYLWCFHADEEGDNSIGELFSKPPYERVKRIPITPEIFLQFAKSGIWAIEYPEHTIPKRRLDLLTKQNSGYCNLVFCFIGIPN